MKKYHIPLLSALLLVASCNQRSTARYTYDSDNEEVSVGDTIVSTDSLVTIYHIANKEDSSNHNVEFRINKDSTSTNTTVIKELSGCHVTQVSTFYSNLGLAHPYYLVQGYRHKGSMTTSEIRAFDMQEASPIALFPDHQSSICSEPYDHKRWELRCGQHTSQNLIIVNEEDEKVYVPQIGRDYVPTDRYVTYQFDGHAITLITNDAPNPHLHPSLCDYVRLIRQDDTHSLIQRVDEMKDGKLRLAVWAKGRKGKKTRSVSEEPDVVIIGGTELSTNFYQFETRGIKYRINLEHPIDNK